MKFNKLLAGMVFTGFLLSSGTAFGATPLYTVQPGDSLWKLSQTYGTTIENLKRINRLTSDNLNVGQKLLLSEAIATSRGAVVRTETTWLPIASVPDAAAPAVKDSTKPEPSEVPNPAVELVDWFTSGKQLFSTNEIFTVTDCQTGQELQLKVLSAGNHCDIEPATAADTERMKALFGAWEWTPRPVIILQDGRQVAGSLSGMPHSIDTTPQNGVEGHFDLYLYKSQPHGSGVSKNYVQQHHNTVALAAQQNK